MADSKNDVPGDRRGGDTEDERAPRVWRTAFASRRSELPTTDRKDTPSSGRTLHASLESIAVRRPIEPNAAVGDAARRTAETERRKR
jgi:hypothetical protein